MVGSMRVTDAGHQIMVSPNDHLTRMSSRSSGNLDRSPSFDRKNAFARVDGFGVRADRRTTDLSPEVDIHKLANGPRLVLLLLDSAPLANGPRLVLLLLDSAWVFFSVFLHLALAVCWNESVNESVRLLINTVDLAGFRTGRRVT